MLAQFRNNDAPLTCTNRWRSLKAGTAVQCSSRNRREHPVAKRAKKKAAKRTVRRSSVTGKFVTKKYAAKHKRTTETERVRAGKRKAKR